MTVWLPWASKHGAIKKTTGPDPAGGNDAGGGMGWPQMVVGLAASAVVCAAGVAGCALPDGTGGCCAASGRAVTSAAANAKTLKDLSIYNTLAEEFPERDIVPEVRRADGVGGLGIW